VRRCSKCWQMYIITNCCLPLSAPGLHGTATNCTLILTTAIYPLDPNHQSYASVVNARRRSGSNGSGTSECVASLRCVSVYSRWCISLISCTAVCTVDGASLLSLTHHTFLWIIRHSLRIAS
jgi:hypothetical protein